MESSTGAASQRNRPGTIARVLDTALRTRPDSPAIEAISGIWSYAELNERADRAAGALWSLGVRPGDRVAACLPNDLDIVAAFHGVARIGAIWAGIGEALSESEQAGLHATCEPAVLLAGERCRIEPPGRIDASRWTDLREHAEPAPHIPIDPHAPAAIAFTSGTSGHPKAVVHSHHNLLLPGATLVQTRGWGPDLRKGDSFPLTILNLMVLSTLLTAQAGGCAVIMDRRDVDGVAEWITTRRVTVWNGAPAQVFDLARRRHLNLDSLREVWSGGGDAGENLFADFAAAHGLTPRATYGLTEAPSVVSIDPVGRERRPRASGKLLPQYDVAAYDDAGRRLPAGELGELCLTAAETGPYAGQWRPPLGHWDNGGIRPPEPGPFATGDIGTVDADGWLSVLDRKKLVIIRGGANIYPLEVERVIAADPAVAAVALCPVPDERLGQRVAALIQSADGTVDFDALEARCRAGLARYKIPEIWCAVPELPLNAMGKVERTRLPELLDRHRSPHPRTY